MKKFIFEYSVLGERVKILVIAENKDSACKKIIDSEWRYILNQKSKEMLFGGVTISECKGDVILMEEQLQYVD